MMKLMRVFFMGIAALLAIPAQAFILGSPQVTSAAGQPVVLQVPVTLDRDEVNLKANIAPESVFSALGYFFPQSLRSASIAFKESAGIIEIAGGVVAKGDAMPVVLEITTNRGTVVRHFSVVLPQAEARHEATASATAKTPLPQQQNHRVAQGVIGQPSATGTPSAYVDAMMQQRVDQIRRGELELISRLDGVENAVKQVMLAVTTAMASSSVAMETINARAARDDVMFLGGASLIGFLMAAAMFGGRRSGLQSGMRVRLVGYGGQPIEGEFVRMVTDDSKPLPYRIADRIVGAPRVVEFRALVDAAPSAVEQTEASKKDKGTLQRVAEAERAESPLLGVQPSAPVSSPHQASAHEGNLYAFGAPERAHAGGEFRVYQ